MHGAIIKNYKVVILRFNSAVIKTLTVIVVTNDHCVHVYRYNWEFTLKELRRFSKTQYVRKKQEFTFRIFRTRRCDYYSRENIVNLVVKKIIPTKWIELKCVRLGSIGSTFLEVIAL